MQPTRADLDKKRAEVSAMFDGVAARYDLLNSLLSFGQDRSWRRETIAAVDARPGERILDLAAGTGTSSLPFQEAGAHVFPTDLSMGMLTVGKRQQPGLAFVRGDALALPYADCVFDAVTISYGLRNVEDTAAALRELLRVTWSSRNSPPRSAQRCGPPTPRGSCACSPSPPGSPAIPWPTAISPSQSSHGPRRKGWRT